MDKHLVIDGNNLAYRAYHQFKTMASKGGVKSSITFGFPYILQSLINTQKPDEVLIAFDGGRDKNRLAVHPEYKGKRTEKKNDRGDFDKDDFYSQMADLYKILSCLGIPYVFRKDLEADDVIWLYTRRKKRKGSVVIVSTDKDFNQLLSSRVSIWHPWKNKRITHKNVEQTYGYTPEQCVDYLIMVGDSSDNITGVVGVGHKTALKFLAEYGSILNYLKVKSPEFNKAMNRKDLEQIYYRNRTLIDIRYFCRKHLDIKKIPLKGKRGKQVDKKELAMICSKYSISIFNTERFLKPFKSLL